MIVRIDGLEFTARINSRRYFRNGIDFTKNLRIINQNKIAVTLPIKLDNTRYLHSTLGMSSATKLVIPPKNGNKWKLVFLENGLLNEKIIGPPPISMLLTPMPAQLAVKACPNSCVVVPMNDTEAIIKKIINI